MKLSFLDETKMTYVVRYLSGREQALPFFLVHIINSVDVPFA